MVPAENVLVVVGGPYYDAMRSSGHAVSRYIQDLTAAGNTVHAAFYYEDAGNVYPVEKANHLYTVIKNYYDAFGIDGAVLIGDLPYAPCWDPIAAPMIFPNDYFFMDMLHADNAYPHSSTWSAAQRVDAFVFEPAQCDNRAEIWVSRITAAKINTGDILDANGCPATQAALTDQYLWRLHLRMTSAEPQPRRFLACGMEGAQANAAVLGFDKLLLHGVSGWLLYNKGKANRDCLSDLPSNWQAQLQRGPYGTQNGQSGLLGNGLAVLDCDSRTYPEIASDTFGFEWAGIYEHSNPTGNWFQGNNSPAAGWFCSTDEITAAADRDTGLRYFDRSLAGMYADGGHPKARFFIDAGCSNLAISEQNCLGALYAMLGNGLICFGSTVVHGDASLSDYGAFLDYLMKTPGATFGTALKNLANSKPFPVNHDVYMLIGAGTLTPYAPAGYEKRNIHASFSMSAEEVDEATNDCSGMITFISQAASGGPYDSSATVYKWYDASRRFIMQTPSRVVYRQAFSDTGHIAINGITFSGDIMIEAAQPGFLSAHVQTSANEMTASIPAITRVATRIAEVDTAGITNWWIDSIGGRMQYSAAANTDAFDETSALYKWYDAALACTATTVFSTAFSFIGSRNTLQLGGATPAVFSGDYFIKAEMDGLRWCFSSGESTSSFNTDLKSLFGVSGIQKKTLGNSIIYGFAPTVSAGGGALDLQGVTADSAATPGCIGGTVFVGKRLAQITSKNAFFSGSQSSRAGVYYFAEYPGLHCFYYHQIYLYQGADSSIHVWHSSSFDGIHDTALALQGYGTGNTWLRIRKTSGDTLECYAGTDDTGFTMLYRWTVWGLSGANCEVGVMYSSGGVLGSARFEDITVFKQ